MQKYLNVSLTNFTSPVNRINVSGVGLSFRPTSRLT